MNAHGSKENGLNWNDGHIPYGQEPTMLSEAVSNFDHLNAWGSKNVTLNDLLQVPIHNLKDLNCPTSYERKPKYHCYMTWHSFPNIRCATRNTYAFHEWLT